MTPEQLSQIETVHTAVNEIPYVETPGQNEPPDYYTDTPDPGHSWVCRMYVQDNSSRLRKLGWEPSLLREALCTVETGERHAVLAVFDPDDLQAPAYVLDSRFPQIYRWDAPPPGYRWEALQEAGSNDFVPIG